MTLKRVIAGLLLIGLNTQVFAGNFFATQFGRNLDDSSGGVLFFKIAEILGIIACIKAMRLFHQFKTGQQTKYSVGTGTCITMFICGTALIFLHHTVNFIYNTF